MKSVPLTQSATFGKYFSLLIASAACLLILPDVADAQQKPQYNVLFIAVDDMNSRVNFLGYPEVITPNLQRLVNRGMVFKQAYCQYPICNASRTSLLTGWRPDKTQVFSNEVRPRSLLSPEVKFLPEFFKENGYHTERYGKMMHELFEDDITWDYAEPAGSASGSIVFPASTASREGSWWIINTPDSSSNTGKFALHLAAVLRQPQTSPFFFGLGLSVHNPFNPNLNNWNIYGDPSIQDLLPLDKSGSTGTLKGNGSGNIALPQTPLNDRSDVPSIAFTNQVIKDNAEWKKTIHAYYAEVSKMDNQLGYVLDELDRQNLWSNTIVVFWSDHGQHLGEHEGLWLKQTLFKESIEVPMIVCVPGKSAGVCSKLVELVDLYPTLTELCGLPEQSGIEGSSFVQLFDNPASEWKRAVFSQVKRVGVSIMGRSVKTAQYHYNSWETYGEELYDIGLDPYEYTNLANNADYAKILSEMRTILAEGWTKSVPEKCYNLTFYRDADGDGFGNPADTISACKEPVGYVSDNNDCNDSNAGIHPSAAEICNNGIDDNCNGQVDENKPPAFITPLGSTDICINGPVTLQANAGTGFAYQWRLGNVNIQGARKRKYTALVTGKYSVIVRDSKGCMSLSDPVKITSSCIPSFAQKSSDQMKFSNEEQIVFPNPSTGIISVNYKSIHNGPVQLQAFDAGGKLVFSKKVAAVSGTNIFSHNLGHLTNGSYFLDIGNKDAHYRSIFIINK